MPSEATLKKFRKHIARIKAYDHATSVMYYDAETVMPHKAADELSATLGLLSEESYKLSVSTELRDMIREILADDDAELIVRREAEELKESMDKIEKIPMDEYVEYQMLVSDSSAVWREAKNNNDFSLFEPYLTKIVEYNRRFAKYYAPDADVYDTLLNQYEKGLTCATLDVFFADVCQQVVPLLKSISERGKKIDTSFLELDYPVNAQCAMSDYIMDIMKIDKNRCVLGETEHPFTMGISKNNVRITTHYYPGMVASCMYSVIHEGGHALYELNIGDDIKDTTLGGGVSMGVHESQSRFYENTIGRSEEFISLLYPKMQELFPTQLNNVPVHEFFLAVNNSTPSLVRTEADELTYPLHIMVRYELEKRLMSGELPVKDLPQAWNSLYKEYLGIDVPSDREGVLQDVHWANGTIGYFPSYALGSAYSAQLLHVMENEFDVWGSVRSGKLEDIIGWLTEKIYKYGCIKRPLDLIEDACGESFSSRYYTQYLVDKFTKIYEL